MTKQKLEEWKLQKKTEAFERLVDGRLDHDQYRVRLQEIDMIK